MPVRDVVLSVVLIVRMPMPVMNHVGMDGMTMPISQGTSVLGWSSHMHLYQSVTAKVSKIERNRFRESSMDCPSC